MNEPAVLEAIGRDASHRTVPDPGACGSTGATAKGPSQPYGVCMPIKVLLDEEEMPRQWYNLAADLPSPAQPYMGPEGPVPPEAWSAIFPANLIEQEYSSERYIDIPEEILHLLYRWRPAPPETSHAVATVVQEALKAKEEGKEKVILFNLSGHGLMDLAGYSRYFEDELTDYALPQKEIDKAEEVLKDYPPVAEQKTDRW